MQIKTDPLDSFLSIFPERVREKIEEHPEFIEVTLDLGRQPEIRTFNGDHRIKEISITKEEVSEVVKKVGKFGPDNRAGITSTLHRISCIRNRENEIIGVTCRVGRTVRGCADILEDIFSEKSLLLVGPPGSGKSTRLREMARLLSQTKRVVVVDTSNEIAGEGNVPHSAIGFARRLQVPIGKTQFELMIEAVENHTPDVIIVDEISGKEEVEAARTITERGVQLIATAHGNTLENIIHNPALNDLIGGIEAVTLGDEEAKKRATQKTILERRSLPTFAAVCEIKDLNSVNVFTDVAQSVDMYLSSKVLYPEHRYLDEDGKVVIEEPDLDFEKVEQHYEGPEKVKLFTYGINKVELGRIIERAGLDIEIIKSGMECDVVLYYKHLPDKKIMKGRGIPTFRVDDQSEPTLIRALTSIEEGR